MNKEIEKFLYKLKPSLAFEYFSRRVKDTLPGVNSNGWTIKVYSNELELLGEFFNGRIIKGKWHEEEKEREK